MTNTNSSNETGFKEVKSTQESTLFSSAAGNFEVKSQSLTTDNVSAMQSAVESLSIVQKLVQDYSITSDSLEFVAEDLQTNAQWGSAPLVSSAVRKIISTHEIVVQPKATQKLINDLGQEAADSIMFNKVAEAFARAQNAAYLVGSGTNSPRGMLTFASSEIEQVSAGASITASSINDLILNLDSIYLEGASFLVNSQIEQQLKSLNDASGRPIYQAPVVGSVATIYGIPVYATNDMPLTGDIKIALANFKKAYVSVQSSNLMLTTDSLTEKPFIKYFAIKRVGGDVINKDAIKLLKTA